MRGGGSTPSPLRRSTPSLTTPLTSLQSSLIRRPTTPVRPSPRPESLLIPGFVVEVQRSIVRTVEFVGQTDSEKVWSPAVIEAWVGAMQVRVRFLDRLSGFVTSAEAVRPTTVVQDVRWPVRESARSYWDLVWEHEIQRSDGVTAVPSAGAMADLDSKGHDIGAGRGWGRVEPCAALEDALAKFTADEARAAALRPVTRARDRWLQQHTSGAMVDAAAAAAAHTDDAAAAAAAARKDAAERPSSPPLELLDGEDDLKGVLCELALSPLRLDSRLSYTEQVRCLEEAEFPSRTKTYTVDLREGHWFVTFHVNRRHATSTRVRRRLVRRANPPTLRTAPTRTKAHAVGDALRHLASTERVLAALQEQRVHAADMAKKHPHLAAVAKAVASMRSVAAAGPGPRSPSSASDGTDAKTAEKTAEKTGAQEAEADRAAFDALLPGGVLSTAELSLAIEMRHAEATVRALLEANPGAANVPGADGSWPYNAARFAGCYSQALLDALRDAAPSYDPLTTPKYQSLHSALWCKATPERVAQMVAERNAADRKALVLELRTKRNAYGDLPLHHAIRRSHPARTVLALLAALPSAALERHHFGDAYPLGKTALQLELSTRRRFATAAERGEVAPTGWRERSERIVEELINACPAALFRSDDVTETEQVDAVRTLVRAPFIFRNGGTVAHLLVELFLGSVIKEARCVELLRDVILSSEVPHGEELLETPRRDGQTPLDLLRVNERTRGVYDAVQRALVGKPPFVARRRERAANYRTKK
jgi:hypothetical protein